MSESFSDIVAKLRKARGMATELRSLLEEIHDDLRDADEDGVRNSLEERLFREVDELEVEDHANAVGEVESWLDDLKLGDG